MPRFNLENEIPSHRLVVIQDSNNNILGGVPLILDNEISIKISSKYGNLWEASPNNFMTLMSSKFGVPSGQFAVQGCQIWQSTDPIDMSLSVTIEMDKDPYTDVIQPTQVIMQTILPRRGASGTQTQLESNGKLKKAITNFKLQTLIPPGPNLQDIWNTISGSNNVDDSEIAESMADFNQGKSGIYKVKVGYVNFNKMIIKGAEPTFSKEMAYSTSQKSYYPSSVNLSLEMTTMEVATTDMIENMFATNKDIK